MNENEPRPAEGSETPDASAAPTEALPTDPTAAAVPPIAPAPAAFTAPAEPKQSWRERVFRWRSVLAVGLAGLVIGGGAGTAITALASHDDGPRERYVGFGPGGEMGPGMRGPGGFDDGGRGFRQDGSQGGGQGGQFVPPGDGQVPGAPAPSDQASPSASS